ncbi:MAG TPA: PAS domain S-box protein [archaeon]|nr:PAS domain S-box protein [archaeon]
MSKNKPSYQELEKRIKELEKESKKRRTAQDHLKKLEKKYAEIFAEKAKIFKTIHLKQSIVNMPELYLDHNLNIIGYSGDFPTLTESVIRFAYKKRHLREFLKEGDFDQIQRYLSNVEALKDLTYDEDKDWQLRYKGPNDSDKIGESWLVCGNCNKQNWEIKDDCGKLKITHKPHIRDSVNCYLMSAEEFCSAEKDIKVVYRIKTARKKGHIRDLSLVLSSLQQCEERLCDVAGYTICSGSFFNSEARIQRRTADIISRPEKLEPDTEYEITVERIGGRIRRKLLNMKTQKEARPLEIIDSNAIYDRQNYIGFTTFSGEAEFYDLEIYTRKSSFSIDQFRIPFNVEVRLRDKSFKDKVFKLRIWKDETKPKTGYTLLFNDITERKKSEEALRQSEKKYRQAVENSPNPIFSIDREGNIRSWNRACENVFKYGKEIFGENFRRLLGTPENQKIIEKMVENVFRKHSFNNIEMCYKSKKGTDRFMVSRLYPVFDNQGNVKECVFANTDITQRKKMEEELEKEKNILDNIIDLNPYSISIYDAEGHYVRGNQAYLGLFKSVPPPDYSIFNDPILEQKGYSEEVLKLKKGEVVKIPSLWYNPHLIELGLPDNPVCLLGFAFPILNKDGRIEYLVAMHEDITERKKAEEALKESESRYRLLAENVTDIIWTMDLNQRFTYFSPSVERILGYSIEEAMFKNLEDLLPPSSLEQVKRTIAEELERENMEPKDPQRSRTVEFEIIRKDGSTLFFETKATFLRDTDGLPVGILGIARDITKRKKTEEVVRQSEETLRTILNTSVEPMLLLDTKGNILDLNETAALRLGKSINELIGTCCYNWLSPEAAKSRKEYDEVVMQLGMPVRFEEERGGTFFDTTIYPVFNTNGEVLRLSVFSRDITLQKTAEVALREKEEKYQILVDSLKEAVFLADTEVGIIREANKQAEALLGMPRKEIIGMHQTELHPPDQVEKYQQMFEKHVAAAGHSEESVCEVLRKDGSTVPVKIRSQTLTLGKKDFILGFFQELRKHKARK